MERKHFYPVKSYLKNLLGMKNLMTLSFKEWLKTAKKKWIQTGGEEMKFEAVAIVNQNNEKVKKQLEKKLVNRIKKLFKK